MNWFKKKPAESSAEPTIPADTLIQLCQQMGGLSLPLADAPQTGVQRMQYQNTHGIDTAAVQNWLAKRLESQATVEHYLVYPQLLHGDGGLYHACLLLAHDGWNLLCFPTPKTGMETALVARLQQGAWGQWHHDMLDSLNAISLCAEWIASGKWVYNTGEAITTIRRAAREMEQHLKQMGQWSFTCAQPVEERGASEPFLLEAVLNQLNTAVPHAMDSLPGRLWLFLPALPFQALLEALLGQSSASAIEWEWQLETGLAAQFTGSDASWLRDIATLLTDGRLNARCSEHDHTAWLTALCPLAEYGVQLHASADACRLTIPSRYVMAVPHMAAQPEALAAAG